ncbi:g10442 [Coccomyxa elongata]
MDHPEVLRPGEKKGFVEEMRFVAMKLHTRDQAPKQGQRESEEKAWKAWEPSRPGYLRFLTESKEVYETLESIVAEASHPEYARFQNTGLERSAALSEDITWMQQEYGLPPVELSEDGPGRAYSSLLKELARDSPPKFLCHFYNVYFAHTAGGRMIGTKVASMILDSRELQFYKYDGDFRAKLDDVRAQLNAVAEGWTREEKDSCLEETEKSFKYSGGLLRTITES